MIKKIKKVLLVIFPIFTIGIVTGLSYLIFKPRSNNSSNVVSQYCVNIEGAVKSPGSYVFYKPKKLREIIFKADVLTSADINSLNLEQVIDNDYEVTIPYKVGSIKKIKWKDLNKVEQLTELGVKNSIAQTIINHRRQYEITTWEEILALKGIGPVTLAQLKDIIDLS